MWKLLYGQHRRPAPASLEPILLQEVTDYGCLNNFRDRLDSKSKTNLKWDGVDPCAWDADVVCTNGKVTEL